MPPPHSSSAVYGPGLDRISTIIDFAFCDLDQGKDMYVKAKTKLANCLERNSTKDIGKIEKTRKTFILMSIKFF